MAMREELEGYFKDYQADNYFTIRLVTNELLRARIMNISENHIQVKVLNNEPKMGLTWNATIPYTAIAYLTDSDLSE